MSAPIAAMPAKPVSSACIARGDAAQREDRQSAHRAPSAGRAPPSERLCLGMTRGGENRRQQHRIGMGDAQAARQEWAAAVISQAG